MEFIDIGSYGIWGEWPFRSMIGTEEDKLLPGDELRVAGLLKRSEPERTHFRAKARTLPDNSKLALVAIRSLTR